LASLEGTTDLESSINEIIPTNNPKQQLFTNSPEKSLQIDNIGNLDVGAEGDEDPGSESDAEDSSESLKDGKICGFLRLFL